MKMRLEINEEEARLVNPFLMGEIVRLKEEISSNNLTEKMNLRLKEELETAKNLHEKIRSFLQECRYARYY